MARIGGNLRDKKKQTNSVLKICQLGIYLPNFAANFKLR